MTSSSYHVRHVTFIRDITLNIKLTFLFLADNFRPYLTSFQGNSFTDYINAVFIDGYTRPREYIVTEWPLPHTLGDLWSLVYDYDCSAVVVLTSPPPSSSFPAFWPDGRRSVKYGPVFTVDHVSHNHYPNIKSWIFRINKKVGHALSPLYSNQFRIT